MIVTLTMKGYEILFKKDENNSHFTSKVGIMNLHTQKEIKIMENQVNLENVLDTAISNESLKDTTMTTEIIQEVQEISNSIELLENGSKMKDIIQKLNEIIEKVNKNDNQRASGDTVRDIKSDRAMTEEDARSILLGDLKDHSTKSAALELGLSYGQIYSCKKGFTFKKVYKEFRELQAS